MRRAAILTALAIFSCGGDSDPSPDAAPLPDAGSVCGDGVLEQLEQCDDGATVPDDGCSAACRLEVARFEVTWTVESSTGTPVPCGAGWTVQLILVGPQMFDEFYPCEQTAPLRTVSLLLGSYTFMATLADDQGITLAEQSAGGVLDMASETTPVAIDFTLP